MDGDSGLGKRLGRPRQLPIAIADSVGCGIDRVDPSCTLTCTCHVLPGLWSLAIQLRASGECSPSFMYTAPLTPTTTFAGSASGLYPPGRHGVVIITWPGSGLNKQPRIDRRAKEAREARQSEPET